MLPARSVCAEHLPIGELARPSVLRLLVSRRVAPLVAARPGDDDAVLRALRPYVEAGLDAGPWPLLDDSDGYWPSVRNAAIAARRITGLVERAERDGLPLRRVLVDLEPPLWAIDRLRALDRGRALLATARGAVGALGSPAFAAAEATYAALQQTLTRRGVGTLAVAWPPASGDLGGAPRTAMQRLVAAPLGCGWDRVGVLVYGSMLAGWSGGLLDEDDARFFAHRALGRLTRALGRRAAAFVGLVGHGKLGEEPAYDHPGPLERDVGAALAAGVGEVSLFCLEGLLGRPDPERWLDALVSARPAAPPLRLRGGLLHCSMVAGSAVLDGLRRVAPGRA